jgi:hypothetical protein
MCRGVEVLAGLVAGRAASAARAGRGRGGSPRVGSSTGEALRLGWRGAVFRALAGVLATGLSACATPAGPPSYLAYQRVHAGARLILNQPVQIPAGTAHVTVQGGSVGRGAEEMSPYCLFEVSTLSEATRTVEPDAFTITRVDRSISPSSDWGQGAPFAVASLGIGIGIGTGGWWPGSSPTQLFYKTRFWLRSTRQPDVRQLTCQWDQMTASGAAFARHLTVEEVRQALGATFTLELGPATGR